MFCSKCGKEIHEEAVICVHCGCAVTPNKTVKSENREWLVTLLLAWFLGGFGVHRFYTGYIGIGIAQLLTLGGLGLWAFIDWICICFNNYNDADGKPLENYKKNIGITVFSIVIALTIFYLFICVLAALLPS